MVKKIQISHKLLGECLLLFLSSATVSNQSQQMWLHNRKQKAVEAKELS